MSDPTDHSRRASDLERQQTSRRLQAACVEGYLTLEDFSDRVGRAMAAQTRAELATLTQDLPEPIVAVAPPPPRRPVATTLVVLSGVERTGVWRIAESSSLVVALGSCKLDLRRATIAAAVTTIDVRVVLGSLEVIVPHGVEVELNASTVLSSKTLRVSGRPPTDTPPRIVITGLLLGASLTVFDTPVVHQWQA